MRNWIAIATVGVLVFAAPAAAQEIDWENAADRDLLDSSLRKFSQECGKIGFNELTPLAPADMQNRMYARLLLLPDQQANLQVAHWTRWLTAMIALGKTDEGALAEGIDRGGAALTAALVDPSMHEEAKRKYVAASVSAFRPFFNACTSATTDAFVGVNYVSGVGSLRPMEEEFANHFEDSVRELKAERQSGSK